MQKYNESRIINKSIIDNIVDYIDIDNIMVEILHHCPAHYMYNYNTSLKHGSVIICVQDKIIDNRQCATAKMSRSAHHQAPTNFVRQKKYTK